MVCYRRFIELPKLARQGHVPTSVESRHSYASASPKLTRSRVVISKPSCRTGLFPSSCIFCGQCRKKYRGVEQKLISAKTKALEERIRRYISWKKDKRLMTRLQGVNFAVKEVKYHGCCRLKYQKEAEAVMRKQNPPSQMKNGYWHEVRRAGKTAAEALFAHMQDKIIYEKRVIPLNDIKQLHGHLLREYLSDWSEEVSVNWRLSEKIKAHFDDEIVVGKVKGMRNQMVYSSILSESDVMRKVHENENDASNIIRDAALILRQEIKRTTKTPLQADNLSIENIERGEIQTPKAVDMFFKYLIGGPDIRASQSTTKKIRINSLCQDSVFCATAGKSKPSKHFILGIALKSLTGSQKIIEILNRLGHCASYHTTEEILTELTYSAHKKESLMPVGMKLGAEHGTGVAWDNFDRYVETESGANTLHDTVGIVYQVVPTIQHSQNSNTGAKEKEQHDFNAIAETLAASKRRRRLYEPHGLQIDPYRKKPRLANPNLLHPSNYIDDGPLADYEQWKMDILWMSSFALKPIRVTPMWVAWNSALFSPHSDVHKVWYLPQINLSPTSRAVVVETMKRSQKISQESNRKTIAVTYDLAIAKMALQVQAEESPNFDKIFVALGSFHVEMAFFSTLGKVVAESGGPAILNECGLLAKGSLKSFYKGKNYKRCKRLHEIFALSLEILHFESFLELCDDADEMFDVISINLIESLQTAGSILRVNWRKFLRNMNLSANRQGVVSMGKQPNFGCSMLT